MTTAFQNLLAENISPMKKREINKSEYPNGTRDTKELDPGSQYAPHPRAGWDEQFARMHELGDDKLLDWDYLPTKFDEEEWEW